MSSSRFGCPATFVPFFHTCGLLVRGSLQYHVEGVSCDKKCLLPAIAPCVARGRVLAEVALTIFWSDVHKFASQELNVEKTLRWYITRNQSGTNLVSGKLYVDRVQCVVPRLVVVVGHLLRVWNDVASAMGSLPESILLVEHRRHADNPFLIILALSRLCPTRLILRVQWSRMLIRRTFVGST